MYHLILFCVKVISHIPFGVLYALSDALYYPLYHVVRYRRTVTRRNLVESFPEKSLDEIKRIEKRFYHSLIDIALESCKLATISPDEIRRRARFTGIDEVNKHLAAGRSVSVFIGHYANWEWISTTGLWFIPGTDGVQIYHRLRNKSMDRLMLFLRERFGNHCVDMYSTVRYVMGASKKPVPMAIGFIADQSPKIREVKDFLHFLNHDVPVLTGSEKITKRFGFEAMYISARRVRRGYYEFDFQPLHPDPKSLPDYRLTELYFERLEQDIRRQPECYLWTHKRFKHAKP